MTPEITIRPAVLTDAEELFHLLTLFVVSYTPQREKFAHILPKLIASKDAHLLVATEHGHVRGYALALCVPTLYANGDLWELQELMVDPHHRSQGIGQMLLQAVVEMARAQGAVEVVVPSRRAGAYYERFGFKETATYYKLKLSDNP